MIVNQNRSKPKRAFVFLLEAEVTVTLFACMIACGMAYHYYHMRQGFDNPITPILRTMLLSFFLLCLPVTIKLALSRWHVQDSWMTSPAFVSLSGWLLVTIIGFVVLRVGIDLFPIFGIIGAVSLLLTLLLGVLQGNLVRVLLLLLAALLFSYWAFNNSLAFGYHSPLFEEELALDHANRDTLFHTAIARMIQTYNRPSTGLDGVPYLHYHYGSHFLVAQTTSLLGTSLENAYNLEYPVIFLAFFFKQLLSLGVSLRNILGYNGTRRLRSDYWFWAVFFLGFFNFLPQEWMVNAVPWPSYQLSESYNIGLSFSFLLISIIIAFINKAHVQQIRITPSNLALVVVLVPLLVGWIGTIKISLMLILYATGLYFFARLRLFRQLLFVVACGVMSIIVIGVNYACSADDSFLILKLYAFPRSYLAETWRPYWLILAFIWTWLYLLLWTYHANIRSLADIKTAFRTRKTVSLEFVGIIALLGAIPGLSIYMPGGSTTFFSDFQWWISLGFVSGSISIFVRRANFLEDFTLKRFRQIRLKSLVMIVVSILILKTAYLNFELPLHNASRLHNRLVTAWQAASPENNDRLKVVMTLKKLQTLPLREKQKLLLFIPQSNLNYWDLTDDCGMMPFVAPAFSGIAMLDGLPKRTCAPKYYGYWEYRLRDGPQSLTASDFPALCEQAERRGFPSVAIFERLESVRVLDCLLLQEIKATSDQSPFHFGDRITLQRWAINRKTASPCGTLSIVSDWSITDTPTQDYSISVHLLTEEGRLIAQSDGPPADTPISYWTENQPYLDYRTLFIPCDLSPGAYQLLVTLYDYRTLERVPIYHRDGSAAGHNSLLLANITVR